MRNNKCKDKKVYNFAHGVFHSPLFWMTMLSTKAVQNARTASGLQTPWWLPMEQSLANTFQQIAWPLQ